MLETANILFLVDKEFWFNILDSDMKTLTIKIGIGTRFNYSYADGNPVWQVMEARGRGTWICEVVECPDYVGTRKCFSTEEIHASIGMANLWKRLEDDSETFYSSLQPGSIIHYNFGFGAFVRCEVTKDRQLLPIALVGNWNSTQLPQRRANGSIYLGYHAEQIEKKKPMKPHASNLYEFSSHLQKTQKNPHTLLPIDLSVPEMTERAKINAKKAIVLQRIQKIIQDYHSPEMALELIKAELQNS